MYEFFTYRKDQYCGRFLTPIRMPNATFGQYVRGPLGRQLEGSLPNKWADQKGSYPYGGVGVWACVLEDSHLGLQEAVRCKWVNVYSASLCYLVGNFGRRCWVIWYIFWSCLILILIWVCDVFIKMFVSWNFFIFGIYFFIYYIEKIWLIVWFSVKLKETEFSFILENEHCFQRNWVEN